MESMDWQTVTMGLGVLILTTIVVVVILMQVGSFSRGRVARQEAERYREVVARYETNATDQAQFQSAAAADLVDVRQRLTEIERMLREVE